MTNTPDNVVTPEATAPVVKPKTCSFKLPDKTRCGRPLTPETASPYACERGGRCREHARVNRRDEYWRGRFTAGFTKTSEALHTFQVRDSLWKYFAKHMGDPKHTLMEMMVRVNLRNWLREEKESLSKSVNALIDIDRRKAKGFYEEFVTPETVLSSERADADLVDLINEVEIVLSEKPQTPDEKYDTYRRMCVTWDHILEVVEVSKLMAEQTQPPQSHSNARF